MQDKIIAVFGGAFNPPTVAHINLAKQILQKIDNIEKVVFVPVSTKYNKSGLATDEDRFSMLKTICKDEEKLDVSSIELSSDRQLYTIETLQKIKEQYPDKKVYFVLGTDNLKELETWYEFEEILKNFKVLVLERDNDNMEDIIKNSKVLKQYQNSFIKIENINKIDMSSSYIRERIKSGQLIKGMVPEEIEKEVISIYKK